MHVKLAISKRATEFSHTLVWVRDPANLPPMEKKKRANEMKGRLA